MLSLLTHSLADPKLHEIFDRKSILLFSMQQKWMVLIRVPQIFLWRSNLLQSLALTRIKLTDL